MATKKLKTKKASKSVSRKVSPTSKKPRPHYSNGEVLAMTYDIWISGNKLKMSRKKCITGIEIKETVIGADSASISILDPDFKFISDNIFLEENKIKIEMKFVGHTRKITFEGYISAIDIDFDNSGVATLLVTCMDKTHKMNRKKKNRTFKNKTSASIVKTIVKKYGFKCVVDSSYNFKVQESVSQSNQTDIDFITSLANNEVHPFTARLVGDTFYYVKMGKLEKTPKMTLTYRDYPHDIISFQPRINKETKQEEVSSSTISGKDVETTKGTVDTKDAKVDTDDKTTTNDDNSTKTRTYHPETGTWTKNN